MKKLETKKLQKKYIANPITKTIKMDIPKITFFAFLTLSFPILFLI